MRCVTCYTTTAAGSSGGSSTSSISLKDTLAGQSLVSRDSTQVAQLKVGLFNHWTIPIQRTQSHLVRLLTDIDLYSAGLNQFSLSP